MSCGFTPSTSRAYTFALRDSTSRRHGQLTTVPPGTYREPIARSAPASTASSSRDSCSGAWLPSASISTSTEY
ncbi:Uncharacterised protein [Mycobacteroides abscessus subsp. abscessus]|nr:Uncharacterised protein [Mycobacteroides abscessus subsp. abscessus]